MSNNVSLGFISRKISNFLSTLNIVLFSLLHKISLSNILLFYQQSLRSKRRPEVITLMFCTTTGSAGSDMSAVEEAGSEKVSVRFLNNRTFYLFPCFQNIENPRGLSGKIIRRKLKRGITRILRFWFARLRSMITRLDTRYLRLIVAKSIK